MNGDNIPLQADPPAELNFDDWKSSIRTQEGPPPAAPRKPTRGLAWALFIPLVLAAIGLVWLWGRGLRPAAPPSAHVAVTGSVYNAAGQPIDGALVFAVSMPKQFAQTDSRGVFLLDRVPSGKQSLIVVVQSIGQEYPVVVPPAGRHDVGKLLYIAPPEH